MQNIRKAAEAIASADALLITAGAGMGVDSGLPDFRGNQGFWNAYPPMKKTGISFFDMANPNQFSENPQRAWGFYGHRLNLYRNTKPHKGYYQLLEIAKLKIGKYFVFTSNVDGHFQKAGYEQKRIEECHGSINHLQCIHPCSSEIWQAHDLSITIDETNFEAHNPLPHCKNCSALARPNILMFGDWNWVAKRTENQDSQLNLWLDENLGKNRKIAIIELGAGKAVTTVRFTSEHISREYEAPLIRINPRDYDVPPGNISLPMTAKEGINQLYHLLIS
jgi:NAD-dependent SIR2 family protein deacetylase